MKRLVPEFRYDERDELLFTVRNSVSHIGVTRNTRQAIRIMVRLADLLLVAIDCKRERFWGHKLSIADTLRDEALTEQVAIFRVKYDAARRYLDASLESLTAAEQAAFKVLAAAKLRISGADYQQDQTCPVCGSQDLLLCHREYDYTGSDSKESSYRIFSEPFAYPFAFECGVCELSLDGHDMEAAGMPSEIELPASEVGRRAP